MSPHLDDWRFTRTPFGGLVFLQYPPANKKIYKYFLHLGNFTGPNDLNLILAKVNHIEILSVSPEGLRPIKQFTINGRVEVMKFFRPQVSKQYNLCIWKLYYLRTLRCLIKGEALINEQCRLILSFTYYMKNNEDCGRIFSLLHEKQRVGWTNFQKWINGNTLLLCI